MESGPTSVEFEVQEQRYSGRQMFVMILFVLAFGLVMGYFLGVDSAEGRLIQSYRDQVTSDVGIQVQFGPTVEPRLRGVEAKYCELVSYPSGNGALSCDGLPDLPPYVGYSGITSSVYEPIAVDVQFSGEPMECRAWIQRDINSRAAYLAAECEVEFDEAHTGYQLFTIPLGNALTMEEVTPTWVPPTPTVNMTIQAVVQTATALAVTPAGS